MTAVPAFTVSGVSPRRDRETLHYICAEIGNRLTIAAARSDREWTGEPLHLTVENLALVAADPESARLLTRALMYGRKAGLVGTAHGHAPPGHIRDALTTGTTLTYQPDPTCALSAALATSRAAGGDSNTPGGTR